MIFYVLNKPTIKESSQKTDQRDSVLPSSFFMTIKGDFNDPVVGQPNSVVLVSTGGDELQGEAVYTSYVPGTNGHLDVCEIKDKKWVTDSTLHPEVCASLVRLATSRTELMNQIVNGELKPIECISFRLDELCYELK